MSRLARHVGAFVSACVGTVGIYALVLGMNQVTDAGPDNAHQTVSQFEVEQRPKPPPQKKQRPKRQRSKPRPTTAPPLPNLGVALSGVDFGLPGLDGALGDVTESLLGDAKDVVMTAESVDDPPRPVSATRPAYPARARARGIEGFVTVSFLVTADGRVADVQVLEAQPSGVFDEVALEAVRSWSFDPATYEGRAVSIRVTQTLRFDLT